jgi:hypothetical protein
MCPKYPKAERKFDFLNIPKESRQIYARLGFVSIRAIRN